MCTQNKSVSTRLEIELGLLDRFVDVTLQVELPFNLVNFNRIDCLGCRLLLHQDGSGSSVDISRWVSRLSSIKTLKLYLNLLVSIISIIMNNYGAYVNGISVPAPLKSIIFL